MSSSVIKVDHLSKRYLIGTRQSDTLAEQAVNWLKHPFGLFSNRQSEEFWALKDVSFTVEQGDVLGVIGRNGSGKSTLLKILSRITHPTGGRVKIKGKVSSLLEVGTGFNPELTGRENIFLNGAILGMSRKEIRLKFDEIVDFSGVEQFIDTPVKRYSSGMYVRLAFSVAAHLEPDILLVDEVLAVGDVEFQKKCIGKMRTSAKNGKTVVFVSHNMGAVSSLCNKGLYLSQGELVYTGRISTAISKYTKDVMHKDHSSSMDFNGTLSDQIKILSISLNNQNRSPVVVNPSEELEFVIRGENTKQTLLGFKLTASVYQDDTRIFTIHDTYQSQDLETGLFESRYTITPNTLRPGEYSLAIGGFNSQGGWFYGTNVYFFSILQQWNKHNLKENIGLVNVIHQSHRTHAPAS